MYKPYTYSYRRKYKSQDRYRCLANRQSVIDNGLNFRSDGRTEWGEPRLSIVEDGKAFVLFEFSISYVREYRVLRSRKYGEG